MGETTRSHEAEDIVRVYDVERCNPTTEPGC